MNQLAGKYSLLLMLVTAVLTGCGGGEEAAVINDAPPADIITHEALFDTVNAPEVIECNGRVDVPPQNRSDIHARISGYVESVHVLRGQLVRRGDILAILTDTEIMKLKEAYLQSDARCLQLEKEHHRMSTLFDTEVVSEKEMDDIESRLNIELKARQSLHDQLEFIGLHPDSPGFEEQAAVIRLTSPISGFVNLVNTQNGSFVEANTRLFEIIDESHKHIELAVFPADAGKLKLNQLVEFTPAGSDSLYTGKVFLFNRSVDESSQSVNVHVHPMGNADQLMISTFVEARIYVNRYSTERGPAEH